LADLDIAEHFCPSAQQHASRTFGCRSPRSLPVPPSLSSCKVENVVADDRGFADNETGTVVDKPATPDRHGRMDVDGKHLGHAALQEMRKLSPTIAPQPMANAVALQRVEALVVQKRP